MGEPREGGAALRTGGMEEPEDGVRAGGSGGLLRECCRVASLLRDTERGDCRSADPRRPGEDASPASAALLLVAALPCCPDSAVLRSESRLPGLPLAYWACQNIAQRSVAIQEAPSPAPLSHTVFLIKSGVAHYKSYAHDGLLNSKSSAAG